MTKHDRNSTHILYCICKIPAGVLPITQDLQWQGSEFLGDPVGPNSPSGILTVPQAVPRWLVIELPVSLAPFATSLNMVAQAGRDFFMAGVNVVCMVLNLRLSCCCCNDVALMNDAFANWASLPQKFVRNCELYFTNMRRLVKICKTWRGVDLETSRILSEKSTLTLTLPDTINGLQLM